MVKTHHCPKQGKKGTGPCGPTKNPYCVNHQGPCPRHGSEICLIGQACLKCKAEDQANYRKERQARAAARELKASQQANSNTQKTGDGKVKSNKRKSKGKLKAF
ncbi:hypothetical protein PG993_007443 [Apiospora rasikravindrae]|uniref:Uncharacterized protein n=1 Tax=Apiospora rasikravindrae TaxID=990691 RepID=A0ABR1SXH8_9PEZI